MEAWWLAGDEKFLLIFTFTFASIFITDYEWKLGGWQAMRSSFSSSPSPSLPYLLRIMNGSLVVGRR